MIADPTLKTIAAELQRLEDRRQGGGLSAEESARRRELMGQALEVMRQQADGDRRQHLRIPAELEVRLALKEASITCGAAELSLGGLSLRGNLWVREEQELLVENLRVGRRDYPMAVRARIVWKVQEGPGAPGAGLEFVDLNQDGKRQIRAVYEHLFFTYLDALVGTRA